jgi:hypothetical protein
MAENERKEERLRLFVVNELSPNPEDWRGYWGRRAIVLAHDEKEAVLLAPEIMQSCATEIAMDRPLLLLDQECGSG